jgi:DNA primase
LVCALLNHPWLLERHCEAIAKLPLARPLSELRDGLLAVLSRNTALDSAELRTQLTQIGLDKAVALAERAITHKSDRFVEPDTAPAEVEEAWAQALALHERQLGLKRELEEAERSYHRHATSDGFARIVKIQQLLAHEVGSELG